MSWHGQPVIFFPRSALAQALNRSVGTIRSLEMKGVLCHPPFRDQRGHWYYTGQQILDLITLADEEGVLDPRYRRPFSERFIKEAQVILKRTP